MNHLSLGMNQVLWSTCLVYLECMITFLKFPCAMFTIFFLSFIWIYQTMEKRISIVFKKKYLLLSKKVPRVKFLFVKNRFESRILKLSNWNDSNVYTLLRWIQSIICLLKVTESRKVFSNRSHIQNNQKLVDSM